MVFPVLPERGPPGPLMSSVSTRRSDSVGVTPDLRRSALRKTLPLRICDNCETNTKNG